MVNTSHDYGQKKYFGPNCWAQNAHYTCEKYPECEWVYEDCKEECAYKDLSSGCGDITITKCKEMGYKEYQCIKYGCVDDSKQTCTCDDRGVHPHSEGDWCYLTSTPCTFLNGAVAAADWTWADCEFKGETQLDCKGVAQTLRDASTVAVKTSDDGPSFAVS